MQSEFAERAVPWVASLALLLIWEIGCTLFNVPEFVLPKPTVVLAALVQWAGPIWFHASHTLITTVLGFAISVGAGVLIGIAVGSSRLAYRGFYPMLVGFNSIPKVAIVPVLVIWFGIGVVPAVLTAFLMSFFPIAVNVATGLATVEPEMEDVLRSLGAKPRDIILKVGLPRALALLLRLVEGRDYARLRRLGDLGVDRLEPRHRNPDGAGRERLPHCARVRGARRHRRDGHCDVCELRDARIAHHALGNAAHGLRRR